MLLKAFLVLFVLLSRLRTGTASSGDASAEFWGCITVCKRTGCTSKSGLLRTSIPDICSDICLASSTMTGTAHAGKQAPLPLRFWHWDCNSDCKYLCMWQRERLKASVRSTRSNSAEKYFGKWPFIRVLGMQEVASVLFSLGNLAGSLSCWYCLRLEFHRHVRHGGIRGTTNSYQGGSTSKQASCEASDRAAAWACRQLWVAHFLLSAHAWLASAVFHGRDTKLTEKWDYYAAGAVVAFNTFLTITRTLKVMSSGGRLVLGLAIGSGFLWHLYHMQFTLFDYGFHVKLCIAAGIVQAVLWVGWAVLRAPAGHTGRKWLLWFVALMHASLLFEVCDFPPIWSQVDSHAVWHLCTIPLAYVWYMFVWRDCVGHASPPCKVAK